MPVVQVSGIELPGKDILNTTFPPTGVGLGVGLGYGMLFHWAVGVGDAEVVVVKGAGVGVQSEVPTGDASTKPSRPFAGVAVGLVNTTL